MNDYEQKQADRRERYAERAARLRKEAEGTNKRAREMASVIPFGQPILIGHHSERADRNYRKRIRRTYEKAGELADKAEHYERRATTESRAISSDDPDAVTKLRAKITAAEAMQEKMKAANRLIRKGNVGALVELVGADTAARLQVPDFCGRIGYADYLLTNNSANIRRMKARIQTLEAADQAEPAEPTAGDGWRLEEHAEDNRIWFTFDAKPPADTRTVLKSHGFKWSPSRTAWVRMLNNAGRFAAEQVTAKLGGQDQ